MYFSRRKGERDIGADSFGDSEGASRSPPAEQKEGGRTRYPFLLWRKGGEEEEMADLQESHSVSAKFLGGYLIFIRSFF